MKAFDQEHIIAYLQNELSEVDRRTFEAALAKDTALQEELALQTSLLQSINLRGESLLKDRLNKLLPQHQKASTPNATRRILRWVLPLTGILLVLIFLLPNILNPAKNAEALFSEYYQAYPLSFTTRANDPSTLDLNAASKAYQEKKYAAASLQLTQIVEKDKDGKYRLALGICALELANYQSAINSFSKLIDPADPVYETHAMWYAALAHLKLAEVENAANYLQKLSTDPKAFHHQEAKELLLQSIFSK
ncbi:MAG: hypothetical protein AB8G15_15155 [Saprospiraceae bacterium]